MKSVWAVNPYDKHIPMAPMAKLLGALGAKRQTVEAVYVADLRERELATDLRAAESRLQKAVASATSVTATTVIWEEKASQTAQVEELVHHAIAEHAALIAAFSRGRRMDSFYRGSFAELLTTVSPLPVLIANPDSRLPRGVHRVLFATDFSVAAQKAYAELLRLAAEAGWKVVVFHAADVLQPTSGAQAVLARTRLRRRKERVETMARKYRVDVTVAVDDRMLPVESLIEETAKTFDCHLICVAAQRRPARRMLLGSHTRRLLRDSRLPILVLKA